MTHIEVCSTISRTNSFVGKISTNSGMSVRNLYRISILSCLELHHYLLHEYLILSEESYVEVLLLIQMYRQICMIILVMFPYRRLIVAHNHVDSRLLRISWKSCCFFFTFRSFLTWETPTVYKLILSSSGMTLFGCTSFSEIFSVLFPSKMGKNFFWQQLGMFRRRIIILRVWRITEWLAICSARILCTNVNSLQFESEELILNGINLMIINSFFRCELVLIVAYIIL